MSFSVMILGGLGTGELEPRVVGCSPFLSSQIDASHPVSLVMDLRVPAGTLRDL